MNGVIEALHIYDEHNSPILSHTYSSRPLSPSYLLPLYLEHPVPRPNLIYLPQTNPPTLVFSLTHANLLFLVTSSSEVEPLLVLEFLHRLVDSFEEFLGAPLLAHKIENNYDVVAQLLTEMCDAGTVNTTEPNALRDMIEVEGFMDKLLGGLNLPTKNFGTGLGGGIGSNSMGTSSLISQNTPALPWRRANVRHTSNELYADVVETLSVTLAPSGRPLAAFANGTIAFTSKVSGVPDIVVTLSGPSGKHNLKGIIDLPVFHPCVRLAKWREQPGVLSFIPPDGRFTLAGYEVDLLPFSSDGKPPTGNLKIASELEMKTGLGLTGSDFEVRVQLNKVFGSSGSVQGGNMGARAGLAGRGGSGGGGPGGGGGGFGIPAAGTPASPSLHDLVITVPLPQDVRNVPEIRPSKGDATYNPGERVLEWTISNKELAQGTSAFVLRCTVVGQQVVEEGEEGDPTGFGFGGGEGGIIMMSRIKMWRFTSTTKDKGVDSKAGEAERDEKRQAQNKILMPSSALVSFAVKGWLPSGIKVESIIIDPRKSRGMVEHMKPYKGVKYLTVSKGGVEIRC